MKYSKMPRGYGIVQTKIMQMPGLSIQAKALYALLASYTGSKDFCFPKIETLARDLECSTKFISRHTKELERKNLIVKTKLYDDMRRNNKYYIMFLDDESAPMGHQCPHEGDPDVPMKGTPMSPSINNNILNNNIGIKNVDLLSTSRTVSNLTTHKKIKNIFETGSKELNADGKSYYHDGKQAGHVKKLEKRYEENPEEFEKLATKFWEMIKNSGDKFWGTQSFDPATFNSMYNKIRMWKKSKSGQVTNEDIPVLLEEGEKMYAEIIARKKK